ncbi:unnamed protein product, partial [Allacma fusca]
QLPALVEVNDFGCSLSTHVHLELP